MGSKAHIEYSLTPFFTHFSRTDLHYLFVENKVQCRGLVKILELWVQSFKWVQLHPL